MDETLKVQICLNTQGVLRGAMDIMDQIETLNDVVDELNLTQPIEVIPVYELEGSDDADNCPVAQVDEEIILNATSEKVMAVILDKVGGEEYK